MPDKAEAASDAGTHFAWDFDRPSDEWLLQFSRFSVAIFQWLKKARGTELKKSPAAARVVGLTSQADAVFAKATELCARLNREKALVNDRPAWLRKQYTIAGASRPPARREPDHLSASQVRAERMKVMKLRLLTIGFVEGKDATYTRKAGDQIHLINFQGSRYGGEFTVNIGFHNAWIPPLFRKKVLPLDEVHSLDCIVSARIGSFLPAKRDTWFPYGNDRDALRQTLESCADTSLDILSQFGRKWSNPATLLAVLKNDRRHVWDWRERSLSPGWLELRAGRRADAAKRLANWKDDRFSEPPPLYRLLETLIQDNPRLADWTDWFAA